MTPRGQAELGLLRAVWPGLHHQEAGDWVLLPDYPLPDGWPQTATDVAFQIPAGLPGQPPYAFYAKGELSHEGRPLLNYSYPVGAGTVPFPGTWGVFSWAPETWLPAEHAADGANLVDFARSFADRFAEGA